KYERRFEVLDVLGVDLRGGGVAGLGVVAVGVQPVTAVGGCPIQHVLRHFCHVGDFGCRFRTAGCFGLLLGDGEAESHHCDHSDERLFDEFHHPPPCIVSVI